MNWSPTSLEIETDNYRAVVFRFDNFTKRWRWRVSEKLRMDKKKWILVRTGLAPAVRWAMGFASSRAGAINAAESSIKQLRKKKSWKVKP